MRTLIVSTVGTSALTNQSTDDEKALLRRTANDTETGLAADVRGPLTSLVSRLVARLEGAKVNGARELSAELNGILAHYQGDPFRGRGDHHVLLTTDTYQCRSIGEAVANWLRANDLSAEARPLDALATNDLHAFRQGVGELIRFCEEDVTGYRERGYRVVFNLVGGFKAVQAYAQSLGMIYADDQIYLFEAPGSPLLHIPRLPITFDLAGVVQAHHAAMRCLALGLPVPEENVAIIPETLLELLSPVPELSLWGQVAWKKHHRELYGASLLGSPSARVGYGDGFAASCKSLDKDRLVHINHRIDQLAQYQATNGVANPPSLNVHLLRGGPVPDATHEAYAWSDLDAKRLFLRFDGDRVIILRLGAHL